jgi:hypothetical protein
LSEIFLARYAVTFNAGDFVVSLRVICGAVVVGADCSCAIVLDAEKRALASIGAGKVPVREVLVDYSGQVSHSAVPIKTLKDDISVSIVC